jgi:glycerol-3-phosphate acyltransferase PlsY
MPLLGFSWVGLLLAAYLIGSIPTAYLAARVLKGEDIRDLGDHNSGAANVSRNIGLRAGLAVGAFDIAKGAAPVVIAKLALDSLTVEMISGILVIAGHNWPIYLRLRGGRGAATAVGVLIATLPLLTLPLAAASLVLLYLTKKAIVALACFLILVPVLAWWPLFEYSFPQAGYSLLIPILVGVSHFISVKRSAPTAPK